MAFCCEINKIINVILCKETVNKLTITDVTLHKEAAFVVNVVLNCPEITCISQCIEDDNLDVLVLILTVKEILNVVSANETGGTCY